MIMIAVGGHDRRCSVPDAYGMKLAMSIGRRARDEERNEQRERADQAPCHRFSSPAHWPPIPTVADCFTGYPIMPALPGP